MKNEFFRNILGNETNERYSIGYIDYLIKDSIYLCKEKKCTLDYLTDCIEKIYGNDLKTSKLKKYIYDSFPKEGVNNFILNENEKKIIQFIHLLENKIKSLKDCSEEFLYSELYRNLQNVNSKLIDIYSYISALEIYSNNKEINIILFRVFNLLDERFIKIEKYNEKYEIINNIRTIYDEISIDYIIKDECCLNILSLENIGNIAQLKHAKKNLIDLVFVYDSDFYAVCKSLTKTLYEQMVALSNEFDSMINEKTYDILRKRYGSLNNDNMTLMEVGEEYSLTRERVRQIEAKGVNKIKIIVEKNKFLLNLIFDSLIKNRKIIEIEELKEIVDKEDYIQKNKIQKNDIDYDSVYIFDIFPNKNDVFFKIFSMYIFDFDGHCKYNDEYKCLYNSKFNFEELISDRLSNMPLYYSKEKAKLLTGIDKKIFNLNYKEYHNIYIRKYMYPRDIFVNVVKQNFPNGFKTYDEEEYEKFKKIVLEEVGEVEDFPAIRSLNAMIERDSTMVLYDRGTVIDINQINDLPEELYEKIIDYIYEAKPVVYYNNIFNKFKSELAEYGVKNQYLLKGLIDRKIPEDFFTKRDYISVGNKEVCPYDKILEIIRSYEGIFSLKDLKNKFNGLADYVFYNILYPEKENGLIFLKNKRFIYLNNLNIKNEEKIKLKEIIENLFETLNQDTISIRKVYARIKLFENKYNLNLNMINSPFDLSSIIQALFPNEYYYSRAFISTNPNISTSRDKFLRNYVQNHDSFTYKDCKDYLTKMNVGLIYSYLIFMEEMSDEYVQVDIDKMVRKEVLSLTEEEIRSIKKIINLLLSNFEYIDTRKFNGYSMFPKLKYNWNKYLLVGIVRTFFEDEFNIKNTDTMYHTTDFIIRRENNE